MTQGKKMGFRILNLGVADGEIRWDVKIKSDEDLVEVKREYEMSVVVNDDFYEEELEDLKLSIEDLKKTPDLLGENKKRIKGWKKEIVRIKEVLKSYKKNEIKKFPATVQIVDFNKSVMVLSIPEEVVPGIMAIRVDIEKYLANLE